MATFNGGDEVPRVPAKTDFNSIATLKPKSLVEDTWLGDRNNKARKISYVSGDLNIRCISASSNGDSPFFYIRLDESFLSKGQYANMQVYSKDQAHVLLDKRRKGFKRDFKFTGLTAEGDYSFTRFSDGVGESITFHVDRDTGNVYEDFSGSIEDNLYMIAGMQILSPEEIISILKKTA